MAKLHWLVMFMLIFGTASVFAAERIYPVYPLQGKIVLDGKLDEQAWQGAPLAGDFLPLLKYRNRTRETGFRILHDESSLYFGIEASEDRMDQLRLSKKDGENTWQDDSIEIFLQSQQGPKWYRVGVNAAGKRSDPDVATAASHRKHSYVLEIQIPFSAFGGKGTGGTVWGNICRNEYTDGDAVFSSWSPIEAYFKETHHFAEFQLRKAPVSPERAAAIGRFVNFVDSAELLYGAEKALEHYRAFLDRVGRNSTTGSEAGEITRVWQEKAETAQRYLKYFYYFTERFMGPSLWDDDHSQILKQGGYPGSSQFLLDLTVTKAEENLNRKFLMRDLFDAE